MGDRIGVARARELGDELREYRVAEGLTCQQLAHRLGWSSTKVSRIENAQVGVTEMDIVRYAAHCGVNAEGIDDLLEMCHEPGAAGYWMSKQLCTLIFHENAAASSYSYDPLVVPGLLQTQEYATALIGLERPWLVTNRMERQRVVHTREFEFFVHEQALRLPVGGNQAMNEQLLKLVLVAEQPTVTIRVIPAALGAKSVFGGAFVLFRYDSHPSLVYLESGFFLDDEQQVSEYKRMLAKLSNVAMSGGQSRERLAMLASEVDRPEDSPDAPDDVAKEQLQ